MSKRKAEFSLADVLNELGFDGEGRSKETVTEVALDEKDVDVSKNVSYFIFDLVSYYNYAIPLLRRT